MLNGPRAAAFALAALLVAGCRGSADSPLPIAAGAKASATQSSNLYVLSVGFSGGIDSVQVFRAGSKKLLREITQGLSEPTSMAFDGLGDLYVANYGTNTVTVYAAGATTVSETISQGISNPKALAVDSAGNLYVANGDIPGSVTVYSQTGALIRTITKGINEPAAEAFDAQSNLYVANDQWTHHNYTVPIYRPGRGRPSRIIYNHVYYPSALRRGQLAEPVRCEQC